MHRLHRLAVVAALAVLASWGGIAPAVAQYAPAAAVTCDTSVVVPGDAFTCEAGGFRAGSQVVVTATGATVGATVRSATAAGQWTHEIVVTATGGVAEAVVQVPGNATGPTSVVFAGVAPDGQPRVLANSSAVTVAPPPGDDDVAPAPVPAPAAPGDAATGAAVDAADDDLPATGSDLVPWVSSVVALVVVGTGLLVLARRRHGDA